ncbi:hypothetical protein NQZ68_008019 [Dissostichus eleginoides]|nr:hypothetical protein NQZ68_008019 [Dissostichus eleginoides]
MGNPGPCYNPAFEEDLFGGLETKRSVEGIKCPPPKPSSLGCPPGGFPVSCREIKLRAKLGPWDLNLASVKKPGHWWRQDDITRRH